MISGAFAFNTVQFPFPARARGYPYVRVIITAWLGPLDTRDEREVTRVSGMGLQDAVYTAVTMPFNVIHKTSAGAASYAWNAAMSATSYLGVKPRVEVKMTAPVPLWKLAAASGPYVRLAALSGAAAVILGAIGSHRHYSEDEIGQEQRRIFETANRYHFIHTLALLGLPLCKFPAVAATFMLTGIALFCGSCYYTAFTNNRRFSTTTPIGGFCFILAWCSMFL